MEIGNRFQDLLSLHDEKYTVMNIMPKWYQISMSHLWVIVSNDCHSMDVIRVYDYKVIIIDTMRVCSLCVRCVYFSQKYMGKNR